MRAQLILIACGVVGGLGLGWLLTPLPEPDSAPALEAPAIVHAGVEARDARQRLSQLGLAPPPAVDAGPPPPDIALLFRRDLTAIEDRPGARFVWIVDVSRAYRRRALRVGDVYQDGWRIVRISPQSVQLRRRREVRTVDAFALPVIEP